MDDKKPDPKSRSGKLGFRLNDLAVSGVGA